MRLVALILTTCLLLSASSVAQDAKKPDEKKPPEKKPTVRTEILVGEVILVESQKQQIKVKTGQANPLVVQKITDLQTEARDISRNRKLTLQERQAALKDLSDRLQQLSNDIYVFTVDAGAECDVRLPNPKEQFDETGNIKKLTPRERAKQMGKDRMFDGEWGDLKMKQIVSVTVVKPELPRRGKKGEEPTPLPEAHEAMKVAVVRDYIEPMPPRRR